MKIRKIILLLVFNILAYQMCAQIPGYLGKRISVSSNFDLAHPVTSFLLDDYETGIDLFNFTPSFSIDYVLNRHIEVGLNWSKDIFEIYAWTVYNDDRGNYLNGVEYIQIYDRSREENLLHASYLDAVIKIHRNHLLAPLGGYLQFSIGISKLRFEKGNELSTYYYYNTDNSSGTIKRDFEVFLANPIKFGFGIGKKKFINNHLFINSYF
jgi:hypothetical protein